MIDWFIHLSHPIQAMIATLFTWLITSIGASFVFFFKKVDKNIMDATLGLAAGIMIASSFWSLLSPAIDIATNLGMIPWFVITIGFLGGGALLFWGDKLFEHCDSKSSGKHDRSRSLKRSLMLIFSITLHNIPEGLAIGVTFGSLAFEANGATISAACMLALGIGLQNFPEGTAISLPLLREGFSRTKAFIYGVLSGLVEPIAGVLGAMLVLKTRTLLPYLLAFAAGSMIYVVVQELIPESQSNQRKSLMAFFTIIGFSIMMLLDVALQ